MSEKGVLSARGERVDFDLLKIKQQIAAAPKTVNVTAREDFIDGRLKRRLKRQTQEAISQVEINTDPIVDTVDEEVDAIVIDVPDPINKKGK
ncbi:MAG: hypothetical protein CTY12_04880 [Methylotenera sp.]|nr:MAG: hypothetical protein CTY12_04880 [Methylotenera sp.]